MYEDVKALCRGRYKDYYGKPFDLTDGQAEIYEIITKRLHPRTSCLTYTQYGKSDTVSMAVHTRITTFPEKWCIVAPSNKKARIIMGYIIQHSFDNEVSVGMFEIEKGETMDRIRRERTKEKMTYKFPDGRISEVFTISSEGKRTKDLLDALMGFGAPNVIIDESSLIDDVQKVGILRMLGGHKDNFLFEIGNAMRRNHFYRATIDPNYHHINITCEQGIKEGRISEEFINEMRTKPMFEQLYMNKFPPEDAIDPQGYTPLYIDRQVSDRIKKEVEIFGNLYLGCDVAGEGSNLSVITLRGRNGAKVLYKENNPDTMNFVAMICIYAKRYPNLKRIYVDKVGIGKPVYDRLKELPEVADKVVGVMAGESAEDKDNYLNKRAEMFWRQREWLSTAELQGPYEDWIDLLDVKYKIQSDKKVKIKSKDEMIADGIQSPDVADSLSLTFYDTETKFVEGAGVKTNRPKWTGFNKR